MQYLKSLLICILYVMVIILSWHYSTIHNIINPHDLRSTHIHLFVGLTLTVVGFLLSKTRYGIFSLIGQGMVFGSLIGIVPCIMYYIGQFFDTITSGFLLGVLAWIFFVIFIGATSAIAVSAAKNAVISVIRLDFYSVIVFILVFFSSITAMLILFTAAKDISDFLAFATIFGLLGGVGGWMVSLPDGTGYVRDANGNMHFVISTLSPDRVLTTTGEIMRRQSDNSDIYNSLH